MKVNRLTFLEMADGLLPKFAPGAGDPSLPQDLVEGCGGIITIPEARSGEGGWTDSTNPQDKIFLASSYSSPKILKDLTVAFLGSLIN